MPANETEGAPPSAPAPAMSSTFEWTDDYRLGIPGVDEEHRTFFALLHAIEASVQDGDRLAARDALRNLRLYAEFHFSHEEEFLDAVGYPDLEAHRREHTEFMKDVTVLEATPGVPSSVAVGLARTWLQNHILGTDRRYTAWLDSTEAVEPVYPPRH